LSNLHKHLIPNQKFTSLWKKKGKEEMKETEKEFQKIDFRKTDKKDTRKTQKTDKDKKIKTLRIDSAKKEIKKNKDLQKKIDYQRTDKDNRKILIKKLNTSKIRMADSKRMIGKILTGKKAQVSKSNDLIIINPKKNLINFLKWLKKGSLKVKKRHCLSLSFKLTISLIQDKTKIQDQKGLTWGHPTHHHQEYPEKM
jgi:hypothetical protein